MIGKPLASVLVVACSLPLIVAAVAPPESPPRDAAPLPTSADASQRSKLLHGTIHDMLQFVHAEYFREEEKLLIPAAGMKRIFELIEERDGVKLRWLVVEGKAMNIDHNPRDDFEKAAALALAAGAERYEATTDGTYRFAGPITLGADCLKCHFPSRSSNKSRTAGLLISMPIVKP